METTVLTSDNMRKVVKEEGLEARNLLNWNVIVSEKGALEVPKSSKKPPLSPKSQSISLVSPIPKDIDARMTKRCSSLRHPKSRVRSSSVGRNPEKSLRARYWAFLFENLYRAVDEIYQTCEMDESIVESKEAIMMLENYCKEFQALIQWLNISKNYEVTPPPNRPTSLAWEVRKSLPSKGLLKNAFLDKIGSTGSFPKKKADPHGEPSLKATAIQTEMGKKCSPNTTNPSINCEIVVKDERRAYKFIPNPNAKVFFSKFSHIETKNCSSNAIISHSDEKNGQNENSILTAVASDNSASVVTDNSASVVTDNSASVVTDNSASVVTDNSASVITDNSASVITDNSTSVITDNSTSVITDNSTSVITDNSASVISDNSITINCEEQAELNIETTTITENKKCSDTVKILAADGLNEEIVTPPKETEPILTEICEHVNVDLDKEPVIEVIEKHEVDKNHEIPSSQEINDTNLVNKDNEICVVEVSLDSEENSKDIILNKKIEDVPVIAPNEVVSASVANCKIVDAKENISNSCEKGTSPMISDTEPSNSTSADPSISSTHAKMVTSDVGVQTVPVETKVSASSITLNKSSTNLRTKGQTELKNVNIIKKTVTAIQTGRVQSKTQHSASIAPNVAQNSVSTSNVQNKDLPKKPAPAPFRFSKPAVNPISTIRATTTAVSQKQQIQRKSIANGPTQELKPFRAGVYEPKLRCASHVPTPPVNYRKFGVKKSSDAPVPSHISRPSQHYIEKDVAKSDQKSASTSSLSSTSSVKSWVGKVKENNPDLNGNSKDGSNDSPDDADGWETVRGRTRCKNSPAKKLAATQNAIDTAMAAKLSQSKMGGFMYNSTSNLQATKPTNSTPKTKLTKDDSDDEIFGELIIDKKSKVGIKSNATALLKRKTDIENKEKKAAELLKGRKKVTTNAKPVDSNSGGKNPSFLRQLSTDNIKRDQTSNQALSLKKSYSSCSIDIKKKENKQLCQKASVTAESSKVARSREAVCSEKIGVKVNVVPHTSNGTIVKSEEIEDSEKVNHILEIGVKADSAASSLSNEQLDAKSLSQKGDEMSSNQSSDLDEVLTSDELDGMISHDEAITDAQELEMYEKMIAEEAQEHISALGLSWADRMELAEVESRTPGRALQMHEKLSSPFRKRFDIPLSETIRLQEEKQLKAQEQREKLLEEKAQRFKDIQKKVEEMKALNEKKAERQRIILEQKLQRAEEKRKKQIEMIVRKAHDEEEKVNEIAFINSLEAQNKRHDLISKEKDHEARLHDIQEERQRKLEEKAAKEAAAEERRKLLEAERQARLLEMQEKRKQRDLKIEQQLMEKEKERQELANQKARDRELRISALNAAQQAVVEELQKKIQLKQEESARRHEENMELIRQKAFELSVRRYSSNNDDAPQLVPYETKKICTICNVLIGSEVYLLSHLRGKKHQAMIADWHQGHDPSTEELESYNLKHIVDASTDQLDPNIALDKERQKALKKRCKKLRQKLEKRASEFEKSLPNSPSCASTKLQKLVNQLKRVCTIQENSVWDNVTIDSLEKVIKEIKFFPKKFTDQDRTAFRALDGLNMLIDLLHKMIAPSTSGYTLIQNKTVTQLFEVTESIIREGHDDFGYLLFTNKVGQALDVLSQRLNFLIPDNFSQLRNRSPSISNGHSLPVDEIAGELMLFISFILNFLAKRDLTVPALEKVFPSENTQNVTQRFETQIADIVSYAVSIGIIDRLSQLFNSIRGPPDFDPKVAVFVQQSLAFLTAVMKLFCDSYDSTLDRKKIDDTTQFMATLKLTDMVGVISLLYCILLHDGSAPIQETPPPQLSEHITVAAVAVLRLLNQVAVLDLHLIQSCLGSEGLSLQLRHIASYLLWYCSHWENPILLHELILLLGYFTVSNPDNQVLIQAGQCPTVLQQLCALPFNYFSNSKLTEILFPTLLACSYNNECNKAVLQQEMAVELLSTYLETKLLDGYSTMQTKNTSNIRWCLHTRFPKYQWSPAKLYFLN